MLNNNQQIRKRILLLGGNFFPELTGIGKYNDEMVDWLSRHSYDCSVICTYPYYPFWKVQAPYSKQAFWYSTEKKHPGTISPITIYRCPHYVPGIPSGIKRILSDLTFFISAFLRLCILLFHKKFDIIIVVTPPFQLGLLGFIYQKLKGAQFIYHIQDLQIDAAVELGMIKSKLLVKIMFGMERFILKHADYVSSISEGMIRKIKNKFARSVLLFPNWCDTESFHPLENRVVLRQPYSFSENDRIILYSGAIGEKQGLHTLLQSAKTLSKYKELKFLICGYGPYKEQLKEIAMQMGLENVLFLPLQPKEKFNAFLNMADVHLVLQKANTNDLVLPSKLTGILSVGGLALVTAEPGTSLYELIDTHKMGILILPEQDDVLTQAILDALKHTHNQIRRNARAFAEEYLTLDTVMSKFFSLDVVSRKRTSDQNVNLAPGAGKL